MKISIPGFIYAKGTKHFDMKLSRYVEGQEYSFHTTDNLGGGEYFREYVVACPHEIIAEVPETFDPRQQLVKNLEAEKRRLKAEFGKRVTEIDRQIQTYLALTVSHSEVA